MGEWTKIFAPATVANVACGFDVLGFALEQPGDEIEMRRREQAGIEILEITGAEGLPLAPTENVAGVALQALMDAGAIEGGFEMRIHKGILPGSGIGSSAASAAGAVFAANEILGRPFSAAELVPFAMEGEKLVSGVAHADNVAPALLGGFTLVRSYHPLDLVQIPAPDKLSVAVVHPQIEVKTADARGILRKDIALADAITQWGNVGGLVAGLFKGDLELVGRSLEDVIIEPIRSILIPGYEAAKEAAARAGALGCSISGSGPSVFALCTDLDSAARVGEAMGSVFEQLGVESLVHVSAINAKGCSLL